MLPGEGPAVGGTEGKGEQRASTGGGEAGGSRCMGTEEGQVRRGRGQTQVSSLQCVEAEFRPQTVTENQSGRQQ